MDNFRTVKTDYSQFSVSVCLPAYNEASTIEAVLMEADRLLSATNLNYEVVVCDDGSTDGTSEILARLEHVVRRMRVIRHPHNQGIRSTFEHLYTEAKKDLVFLNSTDQQWDTSVLFDLLPFSRSWDIVIASRRRKHYGLLRSFISWSFNAVPKLLFDVSTHDAGAVKLVRREIIDRFQLVSRSPFSEAERIIRASRAGYRIMNFSVETNPRRAGKARGARLSAIAEATGDVFRVWRELRREGRQPRPQEGHAKPHN